MKQVVNGYNEGLSFPVFQNSTYYAEYVAGKSLSEMDEVEQTYYMELFKQEYVITPSGWWVPADNENLNVVAFMMWFNEETKEEKEKDEDMEEESAEDSEEISEAEAQSSEDLADIKDVLLEIQEICNNNEESVHTLSEQIGESLTRIEENQEQYFQFYKASLESITVLLIINVIALCCVFGGMVANGLFSKLHIG